MRVGRIVSNILKVGGTGKRGGETKILKKERTAGSRGGCLKKGRGVGWNVLMNCGGAAKFMQC